MGITVSRSDIKADKVFLQLLKPALRHLVSLLKTGLKPIQIVFKEITNQTKKQKK